MNTDGLSEGSHFIFSKPYMIDLVQDKSIFHKQEWFDMVQYVVKNYKEPGEPLIKQFFAQQEYIHNYLVKPHI